MDALLQVEIASNILDKRIKEEQAWVDSEGETLNQMIIDRVSLNKKAKDTNDSKEERKLNKEKAGNVLFYLFLLLIFLDELDLKIKEKNKVKKQYQDSVDTWKRKVCASKQEYTSKVKDKERSHLQSEIEQDIFEEHFSISRPSYHGGKYDGPPLRKLVKEANEIFIMVQQYLLKVNDRCSNEEVIQACTNYSSLLLCIGRLFSLLRVKVPLPMNH